MSNRHFLVIVDDSEELQVAIRFASRRAASTKGGVVLLISHISISS